MFLRLFRSRLSHSDTASILMGRQKTPTGFQRSAIDFKALKRFEEKKKHFGNALDRENKAPIWIQVDDSEAKYAMSRNKQYPGVEEISWLLAWIYLVIRIAS